MGTSLRVLSTILVLLISTGVTAAAVERVTVTQALTDKVIITRANGDSYLVEPGVGCLALWRYEGKTVLVNSPGLFLGVGSCLMIPELDQTCRIWNSEALEAAPAHPVAASPNPPPETNRGAQEANGVQLIQRALKLLGYDPGPLDGKVGDKTLTALASYQASKGFASTEQGVALAVSSLPLDLLGKRPDDLEALEVAAALSSLLLQGTSTAPSGGPAGTCLDGHWIESVTSMGEVIILEDRSVWQVDMLDKIRTMLWLPVSRVSICGNRMINTTNGQTARVTRLR